MAKVGCVELMCWISDLVDDFIEAWTPEVERRNRAEYDEARRKVRVAVLDSVRSIEE
jgi:hypothetical protein